MLTAVILTLNEEVHIADCLASLAWADARLVFDSYSTDETVDLAHKAGARVVQHRFENYAAQRNNALNYVETDWLFFVDADERCTPELAAEIRDVTQNRPERGWAVPRHNYIFGNLTLGAGWFPDYQWRLFATDAVRYEREVHEVATVDGPTAHLQHPLTHFNYRDPAQFHHKQRQYVAYDARMLHENGIKPKFYTPYTQPLRHFWWRFIILKGFIDGWHGLRLSTYMAYYEWEKYKHLNRLND